VQDQPKEWDNTISISVGDREKVTEKRSFLLLGTREIFKFDVVCIRKMIS